MKMRNMLLKGTISLALVGLLGVSAVSNSVDFAPVQPQKVEAAASKAPKYVFYLIGDGMGAAQRQSAEYYLQAKTGNKQAKLTINTLPVAGINTTHSADTLVTDSAAAGTALATGHKTNNGMISMLPNKQKVKTLMEIAEEKGMGTGLITTTTLTHATPAVFASHVAGRSSEAAIADQYLTSGVDFFAGGGYQFFAPKNGKNFKSSRTDERDLFAEFAKKGYRVFAGQASTAQFRSYQPKGAEKVLASFTPSMLPYEVDRKNNPTTPSLAELTAKGIDTLSKYKNGFFMMVEGGRIDHASHAHDAIGTIEDTLAFDDAVKKAYDFYKKHPNETLIVVLADHETGGMGLGFGKNYFLKLNQLFNDKVSVEDTLQGKYKGDKDGFFQYIEEKVGLKNLTEAEKEKIEEAMKVVDDEDKAAAAAGYGSYDPVAIAVTHIVSERANLFWTTYAHSGTAVPLSAVGVGASNFGGYKDNTEIAKTMATLMNFKLTK